MSTTRKTHKIMYVRIKIGIIYYVNDIYYNLHVYVYNATDDVDDYGGATT